MSSLSPGNFYHAPGTQAKKLCLNISPLPFFHTFQSKVMNIFCFFYHFWTTSDGFFGVLMLSLFTSFGRVISSPPSKNLKH
jgi:hypothetical protein